VLFAGGNESGLAKTDGDTRLGWEDASSFFGDGGDSLMICSVLQNADPQQCTIELKQHNCCT